MSRSWLACGGLLACVGPAPSVALGGPSGGQPPGAASGAEPPELRPVPARIVPVGVVPASGASCDTAVRLDVGGVSALLGATSYSPSPSPSPPQAAGAVSQTVRADTSRCALPRGAPSAHFELDLSAAAQPVPVQVLLDAPFAFEVALARGPCGDPHIEQCGTSLYADERSRVIAATLAPDRYRLTIIAPPGTAPAEVFASATIGEPRCGAPPAHDVCTQAQPVDTRRALQSLSGTLSCAQHELQVRCAFATAPDVFYELDLSDRPGETLLEVAVTATDKRAVSASLLAPASDDACGEVLMCGAQFAARVPPGKYRLAVSESAFPGGEQHPVLPAPPPDMPSPFALRIALSEPDCSGTSNDSWQTAIDLDPSVERQRVTGNTACGSNQLDTACYADRGAPDLFYRLDLRAASRPQQLYTNNVLGDGTVSYLLLADEDGSTPQLVACEELATYSQLYYLAPRLYYLVVDGVVRNAAPFDLELELSDAPWGMMTCANGALLQCMADSEPACAESLATTRCLTAAVECGLDPGVLEAFCGTAPECCTGTEDKAFCGEAWAAHLQCH